MKCLEVAFHSLPTKCPHPGFVALCTELLVGLQPDAAPWAPSSPLGNICPTCCLFSHPPATTKSLLRQAMFWSGLFCFGEEEGAGSLCFCCGLLAEEAASLLGRPGFYTSRELRHHSLENSLPPLKTVLVTPSALRCTTGLHPRPSTWAEAAPVPGALVFLPLYRA